MIKPSWSTSKALVSGALKPEQRKENVVNDFAEHKCSGQRLCVEPGFDEQDIVMATMIKPGVLLSVSACALSASSATAWPPSISSSAWQSCALLNSTSAMCHADQAQRASEHARQRLERLDGLERHRLSQAQGF